MGRETRRRWWLLIALALSVSLLEVVAAAMIYMLLGLVADPSGEMSLPVIGNLRAIAGDLDNRTLLLAVIGAMIAFFAIRAVALISTEYAVSRVIQNAAARLSSRLVTGYLRLPFAFHLQHSSAELIRNSQQVTLELSNSAFGPLVRISAELIVVIGILVLLVMVSPVGTALAVAVVGGTSALLFFVVQPRLRRLGRSAHAMHKETLKSQQQCFDGVRDIKVLGRETFFSAAYGRTRHRLARMFYLRATLSNVPPVVMDLCLIAFILVFFAITIAAGFDGQEALAVLGLFGYSGLRLQPSLKIITGGLNALKFSSPAAADVYRDLRLIESHETQPAASEVLEFKHNLVFERVRFRYESADCDALTDIDLTIARGEQIGICGPTGSGKSTLVDLLVGLLAPSEGRVLVDGQDMRTNVRGWQMNLGIVPQSPFLLDDTVIHNIALGLPDNEIDRTAVDNAVRLAQLNGFIAALPDGLDTLIGERGSRVSGGERQRIAIARALYRRPQVLVLDEGTSALDSMTEHEFMLALKELRYTHTMLIVAHRLSTVRDCDRVVFVDAGRMAGVGTFDGLMATNSSFRRMAHSI